MKYLTDTTYESLVAYEKAKAKVYPRLHNKTKKFLSTDSFHDGKVLTIQILNTSDGKCKNPTAIKMHIKHRNGKNYQIKWFEVDQFTIDYDTARNVYSNKPLKLVDGGRRGLDEWGYDELLLGKDQKIKHEILLHSQAKLYISCKTLKIKRLK